MCDNSNRTNNSQYDEDPSYSSQNVGYSGRPPRDQHAPLNQNSSSQYDVRNSLEPTGDRNNGPPSQTTQSSQQQYPSSAPPSDNRSNGSDMTGGSKRLHVSNIPFRFRENDLHGVFAVSYFTVLECI